MSFTWVPVYKEIACALLAYQERQSDLVDILRAAKEQGLPVIPLPELGSSMPPILDPFSFFASFNRGLAQPKRQEILSMILKGLSISMDPPADFDGVPVMPPIKSMFISYTSPTIAEDARQLWELFLEICRKTAEEVTPATFDACIKLIGVSATNLTMGCFWMNPDEFLSLDSCNKQYFQTEFDLNLNAHNYVEYRSILAQVKEATDAPYMKLSFDAWKQKVEEPTIAESNNYFWMKADPDEWSFEKIALNEETDLSAYRDGKPKNYYKNFKKAKPGDILLGYVNGKKILSAICEITKGLHNFDGNEAILFKKIKDIDPPIGLDTLKSIPEIAGSKPIKVGQGTLFCLEEHEYMAIQSLITGTYTIDMAMRDLFMPLEHFENIITSLREKRNIILQGAPGVGKTFVAKRVAYALIGKKAADQVEMIQFHQTYSYEDFIQGYRPDSNGDNLKFSLKDGVFYRFCRRAIQNPDKEYVFIIDEINRGNLSKIIGELMMLVEHDKRGAQYAIPLTYSKEDDNPFYIPENLFLIGMMNTADRSLALVDYALRRRFRFIEIEPGFQSEAFRDFLIKTHRVEEALAKKIMDRMTKLNEEIQSDTKNLGRGYRIGHSFFCPPEGVQPDDHWYARVIENEIVPLLEEYWFDNLDKVEQQKKSLLG